MSHQHSSVAAPASAYNQTIMPRNSTSKTEPAPGADPGRALYELRANVGRLVSRAKIGIEEALDTELAPFGITGPQYVVLSALARKRTDSAAQICRELSYSPGAMTRMLDRLEKKELIRRIPNSPDRRSVKLVLTEKGQAVFPELLATSEKVIHRFLGSFTPEELAQFRDYLERMLT